MSQPRETKRMDGKEGKQKITSPKRFRGPTVKPEIAKKRSEGVKIDIQYNDDGEGVGEGYVQLVSYLGVLARTMVPVYHTDWRVVPVELKEKLWDCVKGAFLVDENSKYNVISSIGTSFRSFRHTLTKEYILPYKDKPEYLLQPPIEYNYIPIEDWRKLVANRLSTEAKYVYIHRVSRKGYAGLQEELMQKTGSRKPIDRWVLWKLARLKKGEYDDVTRPVAEKIDELAKAVEEGKITCVGQKDILTLALGTSEHPGQLKKKKKPSHPTQVSSKNIRKQLLEHEEIRGKTHYSAHVENLSQKGLKSFSTNSISIDGIDILVVILYPLQPNALLPFPLSENISTIREGVGYEVLWPVAFVINDENDEDFGKRKNKMKKIQASPKKIKYENPRDIQLFSKTVSAMMKFQTFLLTTEMNDVISTKEMTMNCICFYIWWLHEHLDDTLHEKIIFVHPGLVSKVGTIAPQIKKIYYLDSLLQQPYQDIKDIVNMGFQIFVSQKKKGSKKELKWIVIEGPKQLDGVMCGYFVMRYMRDIIANRSLLTSQFEGKKTYSRAKLDEVRSEWVSFFSTLILDQVYCCNFEISRSYKLNNICSSWNFENTTST
ncbi:hypothetical protein AAG906_020013 [Vitis piasezkii]